jgi:hypothetical protein
MLNLCYLYVNINVYLYVDFDLTPKNYKDEDYAINHVSFDFNFC